MTCAACSSRIERVLNKIPGVQATVSLVDHRARIEGLSIDDAIAAIRRAGYDARPLEPQARSGPDPQPVEPVIERVRSALALLALLPMLAEMAWMLSGRHSLIPAWAQLLLATLMQSVVAWPFYRSAWRAIRAGSANMETLVSLGTLSAYGWSVYALATSAAHEHSALYFEASVVVIAMVRIGRRLEQSARQRALSVLNELVRLDNDPVEYFDAQKKSWSFVAPDAIAPESLIRVQPNEPIRLDAEIIEGHSDIDESSLTGESLPASKGPGSTIFAGCQNLSGRLTARVIRPFAASRRAEIGQQILSALATRAPIAALADRIAAIFVPLVLLLSFVAFVAHAWLGAGLENAIAPAVAVLVVACPCALGLATPAAIAAGLARAAQQGWLFRSADALQRASEISQLAFDKTGTLTSGRPQVMAITLADQVLDLDQAQSAHPWPDWLAAAAAAEKGVEHPLAGALLSYAAGRPMPECDEVVNESGRGVRALLRLNTPVNIWVGKPDWVSEQSNTQAPSALNGHHPDASAVDVAIGHQWQGRIWVADSLRPDAQQAIRALVAQGKSIVVLSGDRDSAVRRISQMLGNLAWMGSQTPENKAAQLDQWKREHKKVAMVGDGINDAAAMAHAHLGIALASGASIALQTADLTISSHAPLSAIAQSLSLAQSVMRRVKENLFFAFGFNILAIPLAAMGLLSPIIAGSAMAVSSAAVMLNASRILKWRPSV